MSTTITALPFMKREAVQPSQYEARVIDIAVAVTAAVFIILRFVARKTRGMGLSLDDWMEVISFILTLGLVVAALSLIHYGNGLHLINLSYSDTVGFSKILVIFECTYVTAILAIKSSLLLMYNRMFPVRQIRNASRVLWVFTTILTITTICLTVFQCVPLKKMWIPEQDGQCVDRRASLIFSAIPNVLTDFAILALPIRLVWNMEIRREHKYILTFVFLSGSLFIIASVYRFTVLFQYDMADFSYSTLNIMTWTTIEASAGIITACIPPIIPLIQPLSTFIFYQLNRKHVTEIIGRRTSSSHKHIMSNNNFSIICLTPQKPYPPPSFSASSSRNNFPEDKHQKSIVPGMQGMRFQRLGSGPGKVTNSAANGGGGGGGTAWPMEVRVTTTIEVITSILENDRPGMTESRVADEGSIEMTQRPFRHDYGPKNLSRWC